MYNRKGIKNYILYSILDRLKFNNKSCWWTLYNENNWYDLFLTLTEREIKTYLNRNIKEKPIEKVTMEYKVGEGLLIAVYFKK
jgi:hypothetical protein